MTTPSPHKIFQAGLRPEEPSSLPSPLPALEYLVRERLAGMEAKTMDLDTNGSLSSGVPLQGSEPLALFQNLGEYLVRTTNMWSDITENLTTGAHIENAKRKVHDQVMADTRFSDMTPIITIDADYKKFCKIRDLTAKYAQEVAAVWRPKPAPDQAPKGQSSRGSRPLSLSQLLVPVVPEEMSLRAPVKKSRSSISSAVVKMDQSSPFEGDDDGSSDESDLEIFGDINMEALQTRGKGEHMCPKGRRCDKGGVDREGRLVVFDRNSSFAQHVNKHTKPFKCMEPGCPNPPKKRKFARRDGLLRHQHHVDHVQRKPPRSA